MTEWNSKVAGEGCPFDQPRADISALLFEVQKLSVSTLFLDRIQTYRGHCVLVFDPRHATRIDELSRDEWQMMSEDIALAERSLMQAFEPDHINIASIGQMVPHLHWHIVPRYIADPRWGGPIWTTTPDEMKKVYLTEYEYGQLATKILEQLAITN